MRCYHTFRSIEFDIQFDQTGYQRFLREQGLSEYDIKHLHIHFITNFTCSHFKGCVDLKPGGAFFRRGKEYVEQENETTPAFYRPVAPPGKCAAIFLRPEKCYASLNRTFLHETRHHLQHCLNSPSCRRYPGNERFASLEWKDRPWERDAEEFAEKYFRSHVFLYLL
jgi:hypothetical protein